VTGLTTSTGMTNFNGDIFLFASGRRYLLGNGGPRWVRRPPLRSCTLAAPPMSIGHRDRDGREPRGCSSGELSQTAP
jgi:hypothetical protein